MIYRCRYLALFALIGAVTQAASAHDSRPLFIELVQLDSQNYSLAWKVPPSVDARDFPLVTLASCERVGESAEAERGRAADFVAYRCAPDAAIGPIRIRYPGGNPSLATLVRWQSANARDARIISAPPDQTTIELAASGGMLSTFLQYAQLGVSHIALGFDHLLFVACLVFLAGSVRKLILAITGFTIAHSITLSAATFSVLNPPIAPTEAVIALSILFLATEIFRDKESTLAWRFPGVVALIFGLLHGFGFASVLSDIGLPPDDRLAALFAFNVGVELGQLAFVAVLLAALALVRRLRPIDLAARRVIASFAGVLAGFWFWQRVLGFVL
ncbi:MAG: HupE/UreJ family protein [Pseudomonadaceae bacterium]|nr:HupE/UreJ family protein [Pseudomonadaceae bacterium]